jgi:hypothetical protein
VYHYPGDDDEDEQRFQKALERMYQRQMSQDNSTSLSVVQDGPRNTRSDAVHMKLKIKGSPEKIMFFHYLMGELDTDWPYNANRRRPELPVFCQDCKGYIYKNPEYSPEEIKSIARQIDAHQRIKGSLAVKVKMFTRLSNCNDVANQVAAQDEVESKLEEKDVN